MYFTEASMISTTSTKYPYPSTLNPKGFVSITLSSKAEYPQWKIQMFCLIESQELVGFIDGTIFPPSLERVTLVGNTSEMVAYHEEYRMWKRSDRLVKGWILGSLGQQVVATMPKNDQLSTSRAVWTWLSSTLGPHDSQEKEKNEIEEEEQEKEQEVEEENDIPTTAVHKAIPYPYLSSINISDILKVKLTGKDNYKAWERQLHSLMDNQNLLGFIQESRPKYMKCQSVDEDYIRWRKIDQLLKGWILGSLNKDVLATVKDLPTSREVLSKLVKSYAADGQSFIFKEPLTKSLNIGKATDTAIDNAARGDAAIDNAARGDAAIDNVARADAAIDDAARGDAAIGYAVRGDAARGDNSWYEYMPLYKATLGGDWATVQRIFENDKEAKVASIAILRQTVLHIAVTTKNNIFLEKLVGFLLEEDLKLKMTTGSTALHIAATCGNTEAVKILMNKNRALLLIEDNDGVLPITSAINNMHKDTFLCLQSFRKGVNYKGQVIAHLLTTSISTGFFDIALELVGRYPNAVRDALRLEEELEGNKCPLLAIARKSSRFKSGMRLNFLGKRIFSYVPLEYKTRLDKPNDSVNDVENPNNGSNNMVSGRKPLIEVCQRLRSILWGAIEYLVPSIKKIRHKKLEHHQAIQLVRCFCEGFKISNNKYIHHHRITSAVLCAAEFGAFEVIEEIVGIFPHSIWSMDKNNLSISHIAIKNRCRKVFKFIDNMNGSEKRILLTSDDSKNCILHLVAHLAPQHKLNLISGAALQMQRELQWYQEVKKLVRPLLREFRNNSGETPAMVFAREHQQLVIDGEKWMRDTADSCTIAASLIITIVFASAITVPGGIKGDNGHPIFINQTAFWLFAVSDAISLFTSTTSLLMFLSILTARYAPQDFLHALPKRLILGLLTLFISITSMVIAFSAAIYLVIGEGRGWIFIPLAALSCIPITSFVTLQFPLLIDVLSSTYGHGVFGKRLSDYS